MGVLRDYDKMEALGFNFFAFDSKAVLGVVGNAEDVVGNAEE